MASGLVVPSRRGFIAGLAGLMAAPAIVHASSLMAIKALKPSPLRQFVITNYCSNGDVRLDILYGTMKLERWSSFTLAHNAENFRLAGFSVGDLVNIEGLPV